MKYLNYILAFILGSVFFGNVALAAPSYIYQSTILPQSNNAYDLGTTTGNGSSGIWRNLYVGTASTSALTVSSINGSTQCLQINSQGIVSGFGSGCGGTADAFPFTAAVYGSQAANSTSTLLWLKATPLSLVASSTFATYASSTQLTNSGNTWLSTITSSLMLTGADGLIAEYAGTSCTNQFARSLSALGAATCATVGAADVALANLTATNGTLTFSGTYDGSTARTIGLNLGNPNTWTAVQTFTYASTTNLTALTNLWIPASSDPSILNSGHLAVNTSTSSLRYHDGTREIALYAVRTGAVTVASTTLAYSGGYGAAGTTTVHVMNNVRPVTAVTGYCVTDVGTAKANLSDGTNITEMMTCSTTPTPVTFATNNTWIMREGFKVNIGTQATNPNYITVNIEYRTDAD